MVTNMQISFLKDVKPQPHKTACHVQVKVLHSWRQYTKIAGDSLELIISDAHVTQSYMQTHAIPNRYLYY
ncbi:hypothetical protein Bca4012_083777 [Brassica carinata]|uniref:Uncharacterized protein n=1 Tax=Brassica carinata TaxID=52824 RepID=A0A8X7SJ23_BRACI|nr:hypothetical protein Bca52824_026970 [Brassica carinata]